MLLRKPRSYAEVYNDLDVEIVNLFRVLREPVQAARLIELLELTPFARAEFGAAYEPAEDPVERARHLLILSFMGFGSNGHNPAVSTGFRANSSRSGTTPAYDWAHYPVALRLLVERMRGVVIENRDALDCMAQHDSAETLHYVDPPYVQNTRARFDMQRAYVHELDDAGHAKLLAFLLELKGAVMVSGYRHAMYDEALAGWQRVDMQHYADGARPRIECLWLNPLASQRVKGELL